jgi:hypothetical protein
VTRPFGGRHECKFEQLLRIQTGHAASMTGFYTAINVLTMWGRVAAFAIIAIDVKQITQRGSNNSGNFE